MPQPSLQDIVTGADLTNVVSIPGSAINTAVNSATPASAVGFIIWTTDTNNSSSTPTIPDPTASNLVVKWKQYIWGRISPFSQTVILYYWNVNGASGALLQWQPLYTGSIGAGTITGNMIANGTIGTVNLAANSVTDTQIANVSASKIVNGTLPITLITFPASSLQQIRVNAGATALEWFTPALLITGATTLEATIATSKNSTVSVNDAGTGYNYSSHAILQRVDYTNSTLQSTTTVGLSQTTSNSDIITGFGSSGVMTFAPVATTSTIIIEANVKCAITSGSALAILGLYNGGTSPVDLAAVVNSSTIQSSVNLKFKVANTTKANVIASTRISMSTTGGATVFSSPIGLVTFTEYI